MTIHRSALLLVLLAGILLGGLAAPGPGSAHLDLVETTPRDGATLGAPVERVTLSFTVPGEPVGQGIRILDGEGAAVPAAVRESADGTTFVVVPSSPLEAGRFGVAWRVAAPDAHPKTGTFTFRVTPPATRDAGAPGGAPAGAGTGTGGGVEATGADDPLAAALAPPDERGPRALGVAGRALVYAGGLLAIGGLAFLWFAMAGTRREVLRLFAVVRVAGAVVVLGGLIGVVARAWLTEGTGIASAIAPSALRDALGGEAGLSLVLAIAGGAIVALGARAGFRPAPRVALAAWEGDGGSRIVGASPRNAVLAVAGVMAVAVGAALDGHSASEGPRALVWAAPV
jgi:copper transport protein